MVNHSMDTGRTLYVSMRGVGVSGGMYYICDTLYHVVLGQGDDCGSYLVAHEGY